MSNMGQTDEIDALVSSVRNLVSSKDAARHTLVIKEGHLVLTPDLRVESQDIVQHTDPSDFAQAEGVSDPLVLETQTRDVLASLEATIAELEAAVTAQPNDWEPDEGESFAPSAWAASAFQVQDSAATDATPLVPEHDLTLEGVAPEEPFDDNRDPSPFLAAEPDASISAAIDEAMLRALVLDIVHDELGGELGERITRNVRKLVRREINRVLASRDMGQM